MFIFASLAFAKRYIELRQSMSKGGQIKSRGYHTDDLEMVASMGPTAGYIAVLVFCLYIESNAVKVAYRMPVLLWFVCPVLLYWISRVWFLAHRGQMQDDPVKFALTDRVSWACAGAARPGRRHRPLRLLSHAAARCLARRAMRRAKKARAPKKRWEPRTPRARLAKRISGRKKTFAIAT